MARAQRILCQSCPTGRIDIGSPFCGACGYPTAWASHDDRVQWEVSQWRRTRDGSNGSDRPLASVATIAPPARASAPDDSDRKLAVMTAAPLEVAKLASANGFSRAGWIAGLVRRVREMFRGSLMVQLDPVPRDVWVEAPVAVAEEPPLVEVVEEPAVVEVIEEPAVVAVVEEPAAPEAPILPAPPKQVRTRPQRPTNKDMLKATLNVLTKVEQRLEHLELEVAEIASKNELVAESAELERLPI